MKNMLVALALVLSLAAPSFAQAPPAPPNQIGSAQVGVSPIPIVVSQSPAVVDTGSIAGQALIWVVTVFGGAIGTVLTGFIYKLMQKAGVQASQAMREKLQDIAVNAINFAAAQAAQSLAGRGKLEIKNAAVAQAVVYVQEHGAETLKQLGLDPTSPEAVQAITARIETAIADPATPTAPVLDGKPADAPAPPAPAKA